MQSLLRISVWPILFLCGLAAVAEVQAHPAWGIAVTPQGTVYFADVERNRIWMINNKGRLRMITSGVHSHGLFYAADGYLYGEDLQFDNATQRWAASLWRTLSDNRVETVFALTPNPPAGVGLCRDAAGNTFAIEQNDQFSRIWKRTPDGAVSLFAGQTHGYADGKGAQAKFSHLEAITLDTDNALYVRDAATIRRIASDGTVSTVGGFPLDGKPHTDQNGLLGLGTDGRGNVYVADMEARNVRRIHPDNRVETVWESSWFWTPTGVACRNGEIYVLENLANTPARLLARRGIGPYLRVHRIGADGQAIELATVWGSTTRTATGLLILSLALFSLWRLRRSATRDEF